MSNEDLENILSKNEIIKYGNKARNSYAKIQGNCGKIADEFEGHLIDYCGLPYTGEIVDDYGVMKIRVGPNGEEKHFVFYINGKLIKNYNSDEKIIIDLSFDQFNNKNKNQGNVSISYGEKKNLDKIRIMNSSDNRLKEQYMSIRKFFK